MNKQSVFFGGIAIATLALVGALGYMLISVRDTLTDRIATVEESQLESTKIESAGDQVRMKEHERKMAELLSDLETMKERMGVTSTELKRARDAAQALRRQQEEAAKVLTGKLAAKADSTDIDGLRQETSKLAAVQQDSSDKMGDEINGLKKDLVATRDDWGRQLVDVKNGLGERIARNSTELSELRRKGDRDYFEFDIRKNSKFSRVGDIQLALLKTDPKRHKYNVAIEVDDRRLEKKDRTTNEPVQFLVGSDHLRYEVVVNSVDKDRIRGYVSAPKEIAANETSRLRLP